MEACLEAQKAGKLRFIGFTGHKDPRIHRDMLEDAKQHNFRFDTVQMPVTVRSCCAKGTTWEVTRVERRRISSRLFDLSGYRERDEGTRTIERSSGRSLEFFSKAFRSLSSHGRPCAPAPPAPPADTQCST